MTSTEEHAVASVARAYIEGWFAADAERMAAALHPQLVKRSVVHADGETSLLTLSRDDMVAATAAGGGLKDAAAQTIEVDEIRVDADIASARVVSTAFIDFLHLVHDGQSWRIVNAVWRSR